MEFLSNLIIRPLYFILEFLFVNLFSISENIILTIFLISFIVSLACLPLYIRADFLQEEEQ